MHHLRRYLIAGLLIWVPLGVTVLTIRFLVDLTDQTLLLLPPAWRPEQLIGVSIPGLGVVLAFVVVLVTGIVVANLFGRRLVALWEAILARIPLVRTVYATAKQVAETLLSDTGQSFREVVLIEYPRPGLWTMGFITGNAPRAVAQAGGREMVSVFVPTTPLPTSGFYVLAPRSELRKLDMSVDAAIRLVVSAGVVVEQSAAEK
jgi:uncharacterized membrane protein